jgi:hypothetical protein
LLAIGASIALMVARGIMGPSAPLSAFPAAPPLPPWFFHLQFSPELSPVVSWLAVVVGAAGLGAAMTAVRRGWRPNPRHLILGSVLAVIALTVIPPVASGDPLMYAAFGRIAVLGHSPYATRPYQLLPLRDPVRTPVADYPEAPSRYGPLATLSEAAAAELAGDSTARTLFWLKVWNALAFLALVLALDRLVRSDAARRVRVHLMWSMNPLMLFLLMADGHNDVLAASLGAIALLALRKMDSRRALLAGGLVVLAIAVKASYAGYGVAMAWAARRSPRGLSCLALGAAAVIVPSYLLVGRTAISATTFGLMSGAPPNLLWHDAAGVIGWQDQVARVNALGLIVCAALAAILLWRMPPGPRDVPAVRVALGLALALLIAGPYQQGWYDAMIFPLLAVTAASRLDWIAIAHTTVLAFASVPFYVPRAHPLWTATAERISADVFVAVGLAAVAAALLWLCATGNWRSAAGRPARIDIRGDMRGLAGSVLRHAAHSPHAK